MRPHQEPGRLQAPAVNMTHPWATFPLDLYRSKNKFGLEDWSSSDDDNASIRAKRGSTPSSPSSTPDTEEWDDRQDAALAFRIRRSLMVSEEGGAAAAAAAAAAAEGAAAEGAAAEGAAAEGAAETQETSPQSNHN